MNKKLITILKVSFGIFLFILLFYKIGFTQIISNMLKINPLLLAAATLIFIITLFIGAYNIKILSDRLGKKISFIDITKYSSASWALGMVSPGKVGEFTILYFFKKRGLSLAEGLVVSLSDKAISFFFLLIVSVYGLLLVLHIYSAIIYIVILIIAMAFCLLFILSNFGRNIIKKYLIRKYSEQFKGFSKTLFYFLEKQKLFLFFNFIITSFKWVINAFVLYLIFLGLGINIDVFIIMFISSISMLISLIPISLAGLGIREYSAVYLFSKISLSSEITMAAYTILLIIKYVISFLAIIFFYDRNLTN